MTEESARTTILSRDITNQGTKTNLANARLVFEVRRLPPSTKGFVITAR